MEEVTKERLSKAIECFDNHRAVFIQYAYRHGGNRAVSSLLDKYDALRYSFFDLIDTELDMTNPQLAQLMTEADADAVNLSASIDNLNQINTSIALLDKTLNVVGQILAIV